MTSNATAERLKHVQELRKAHFNFGFDNDNQHSSVAKQPMVVEKSAKVRPMSTFVQREQISAPINPQLQKNHFNLGQETGKMESIQHTDFQRPQSAAIAQLSEDTKKDLRAHHFQFGYHQFDTNSEYKQKFSKFDNNRKKADVSDPRKHHHDFGDQNSYYSSIYDAMHNQQYDKSLLKQGLSKQQMMEQNIELRKTNLNIGTNQTDYVTQNMAIHKPMYNNYQSHHQNQAKGSNLVMGNDQVDYKSQAQATYTGQPQQDKSRLSEETRKDLRSSHFGIGNEQVNYESLYKKQFQEPKGQITQQLNPKLQQNNFDLVDRSSKMPLDEQYKSSYNAQFSGQQQQQREQVIDKSRNVHLGNDQPTYTSEAAARFKNFNGNPGKLGADLQKDLKSHHYAFGDDRTGYQSQNKATYCNQYGQPSKLDQDVKNDLRAHHFHLGFTKPDYKTHHQEIGSKQGPANKLPQEIAARIKAHSQQN